MMDYNEKTSDATTDMAKVVKTSGVQSLPAALALIDVYAVPDSALVRIEHNWVAPDPLKTPNPDIKRLSDYHYWKVDGIFPATFFTKCRFKYNRVVNTATGNLDNILLLTTLSVDSLLLLYRKSTAYDWAAVPFIKAGTANTGYLIVDTLRKGEYTLAIGKPYHAGINKISEPALPWNVYPNPSNNSFTFSFNDTDKATIKIFDSTGKQVETLKIGNNNSIVMWNTKRLNSGNYIAVLYSENNTILGDKKLVLIK